MSTNMEARARDFYVAARKLALAEGLTLEEAVVQAARDDPAGAKAWIGLMSRQAMPATTGDDAGARTKALSGRFEAKLDQVIAAEGISRAGAVIRVGRADPEALEGWNEAGRLRAREKDETDEAKQAARLRLVHDLGDDDPGTAAAYDGAVRKLAAEGYGKGDAHALAARALPASYDAWSRRYTDAMLA